MAPDERAAFGAAAAWFRRVAAAADGRWDDPGLGEWTVRDLVGHTSRSLVTVETYLAAEPAEITVTSPVAYFETLRGGDSAAITERGRAAGRAMGQDPLGFLAALDARVQAAVTAAADDAFVASAAGGMRLIDYLPTRTFELVVHTADLCVAVGVTAAPPAVPLVSALRLSADLAASGGTGVELLLALTGRTGLPPGFTVL